MSLSTTTLAAIQQAGAAAFAADAELKKATQDYAERVQAAMGANPYGLGNDALFEHWKLVARLSQTMAGIEEELKKVYQLASELSRDDELALRAVPALAAPTRAVEPTVPRASDLTPTDVWVKPRTRTAKTGTRAAKVSPGPNPARPAGAAVTGLALSGNPAKLLRHFERVLNPNQFTEISQTASGQATGIPLGSMTAAIKKLLATGHIIVGPAGSFRLAP